MNNTTKNELAISEKISSTHVSIFLNFNAGKTPKIFNLYALMTLLILQKVNWVFTSGKKK